MLDESEEIFNSCLGIYNENASDLLKELPNAAGPKREQSILEIAKRNIIPPFNKKWIPVPIEGGGHTGTIFVTPDYFSIGNDKDFVRVPMSPITAEHIGRMIGGVLPTKKMVNAIHLSAPQILTASPMPPGPSMMSTDYFVRHNQTINRQFDQKQYMIGNLTSGHKKDVVVSPRMDPKHVCIYGWFRGRSPDTVIQGPRPNCRSHGVAYSDYSHGIRFVRNTMIANGETLPVTEVLCDPNMSTLLSDEGPLRNAQYTKKIKGNLNFLIVGAIFFGLGFIAVDILT
jgi:hypothetical protein